MTALIFKIKSVLITSVLVSAVMFGSFAQVAPAISINANCQNAARFDDLLHWLIAKSKKIIKKTMVRIRLLVCPLGIFNRRTTPKAKPLRLNQISVLGEILPFLIAQDAPSKSEIGKRACKTKMKK